MSACGSCGAPIRWARTEKGKSMPLDVSPNPRGNIVLRRIAGQTVAHVLSKIEKDGDPMLGTPPVERETRYLSHYVTCPDAKSHRRKS